MLWCCYRDKVIARVYQVYLMNVEHVATNLQTVS